jgi:hypothetical protein
MNPGPACIQHTIIYVEPPWPMNPLPWTQDEGGARRRPLMEYTNSQIQNAHARNPKGLGHQDWRLQGFGCSQGLGYNNPTHCFIHITARAWPPRPNTIQMVWIKCLQPWPNALSQMPWAKCLFANFLEHKHVLSQIHTTNATTSTHKNDGNNISLVAFLENPK